MDPEGLNLFLALHRIGRGSNIVDISAPLLPASIPDQYTRGVFAAACLPKSWLQECGSHVIVIGAGVAGIAAALSLQKRGKGDWFALTPINRITLVCRDDKILKKQQHCRRHIYPKLYRWPSGNYRSSVSSIEPLSYSEGPANEVMRDLIYRFELNLKTSTPRIEINLDTTVTQIETKRHGCEVTCADGRKFSASAAIVAAGFDEVVTIPGSTFRSTAFWENDELINASHLPDKKNDGVSIFGGGDGAIQDVVRTVTRSEDIRAFVHTLESKIDSEIWKTALSFLSETYKQWLTRWLDAETKKEECELHSRADRQFQIVANHFLKTNPNLREYLKEEVQIPSNLLIHRCKHVTPFYALNRFVYALLKTAHGEDWIEIKSRLTQINAIDPHRCSGTQACSIAPHQIYLETGISCHDEFASSTLVRSSQYISLRFGAKAPKLVRYLRGKLERDQAFQWKVNRKRVKWALKYADL